MHIQSKVVQHDTQSAIYQNGCFFAQSPNRSTKLSAALLPSGSWSLHWLLLFQKASHLCHMLTDLCMLQS